MIKAPAEAVCKIKGLHEAAVATAGVLLVDTFFRQEATIRAGAGVAEHLADSIQSAFVAPQISDDFLSRPNHNVDLGLEAGLLGGSAILARSTGTSFKGLVATAASC